MPSRRARRRRLPLRTGAEADAVLPAADVGRSLRRAAVGRTLDSSLISAAKPVRFAGQPHRVGSRRRVAWSQLLSQACRRPERTLPTRCGAARGRPHRYRTPRDTLHDTGVADALRDDIPHRDLRRDDGARLDLLARVIVDGHQDGAMRARRNLSADTSGFSTRRPTREFHEETVRKIGKLHSY